MRSLLAGQYKPDRTRHLEPCLAGSHSGSHIGTAHTGRECSQRTVGTGMGIRTDDHITCNRQSFLGQQSVFDTHLSHFKVIGNLISACKLSHAFAMLSGLDVLVGYKMVRHECDLILVKHSLRIEFLHLLNGNGACDIIAQNKIQICLDQLTGFHPFKSGCLSKNLLCHCHSHYHHLAFQNILDSILTQLR